LWWSGIKRSKTSFLSRFGKLKVSRDFVGLNETFSFAILVNHKVKELTTEFSWKRDRLFDKNACEAILDICKENPTATVEKVESKPKSKWRPVPLDTVVNSIDLDVKNLRKN
jgi:DNA topoisomerase IA